MSLSLPLLEGTKPEALTPILVSRTPQGRQRGSARCWDCHEGWGWALNSQPGPRAQTGHSPIQHEAHRWPQLGFPVALSPEDSSVGFMPRATPQAAAAAWLLSPASQAHPSPLQGGPPCAFHIV